MISVRVGERRPALVNVGIFCDRPSIPPAKSFSGIHRGSVVSAMNKGVSDEELRRAKRGAAAIRRADAMRIHRPERVPISVPSTALDAIRRLSCAPGGRRTGAVRPHEAQRLGRHPAAANLRWASKPAVKRLEGENRNPDRRRPFLLCIVPEKKAVKPPAVVLSPGGLRMTVSPDVNRTVDSCALAVETMPLQATAASVSARAMSWNCVLSLSCGLLDIAATCTA